MMATNWSWCWWYNVWHWAEYDPHYYLIVG